MARKPVSFLLFCGGVVLFHDRLCHSSVDQTIGTGHRYIPDLYDRRAGGHGYPDKYLSYTGGSISPGGGDGPVDTASIYSNERCRHLGASNPGLPDRCRDLPDHLLRGNEPLFPQERPLSRLSNALSTDG